MYREVEIGFKLKFESTSADFLAAAATAQGREPLLDMLGAMMGHAHAPVEKTFRRMMFCSLASPTREKLPGLEIKP